MDKKSLEVVFSIAICRQSGDKYQSKTLFLMIFDLLSSIALTFLLPPTQCDEGRPIAEARVFLLVDLWNFFSDQGSGGGGAKKKALNMTSLAFFNISRTNSKLVR